MLGSCEALVLRGFDANVESVQRGDAESAEIDAKMIAESLLALAGKAHL